MYSVKYIFLFSFCCCCCCSCSVVTVGNSDCSIVSQSPGEQTTSVAEIMGDFTKALKTKYPNLFEFFFLYKKIKKKKKGLFFFFLFYNSFFFFVHNTKNKQTNDYCDWSLRYRSRVKFLNFMSASSVAFEEETGDHVSCLNIQQSSLSSFSLSLSLYFYLPLFPSFLFSLSLSHYTFPIASHSPYLTPDTLFNTLIRTSRALYTILIVPLEK